MAGYSSRGPTAIDGLIKPDLVAPGNKIESLMAPNSDDRARTPWNWLSGAGRTRDFSCRGRAWPRRSCPERLRS